MSLSLVACTAVGRNAWGCNVNETLMRQTIDAFVTLGLKDVGFKYVSMDGRHDR